MTDTPDPKEAVTDELTEQLDVSSLVAGDSVTEQVDGASLGRAFGEAVGALAGRQLGRVAVDRAASKVPFKSSDEEGDRSLLHRLGRALVVAVGRTLRQPQFREPIEDALRGYVEQREKALDDAKETAEETTEKAAETVKEGASEASDTAQETAEEAVTETNEADDEATSAASSIDASDLSADDVQTIREETYRDLLETMDYSELQSIAKEVGVKANLQRDEMVDAVVEEFNDGSETDDGGNSDGE
ncbi:hypothetical protein ACFFQF_08090 [Haladaptatus pallidirubidus]|uniref:Rho termination factor, N-terminal domain n=1 Tax=Haladaptatus pallidirubidus TaxID=1008152 RepID=A0AAV3UHL2_9EURY|nr:hypothetical protein [Haladaptatus pallidirubidus]